MAEPWQEYLEAVPLVHGGEPPEQRAGGGEPNGGGDANAAASIPLPVPQAPPTGAVDTSGDVLYARGAAGETGGCRVPGIFRVFRD